MTPPPLCIIQARYHSTRLPGKMLLPLGGETLIARAVRMACAHFGPPHVVVAIPETDWESPLGDELRRIDARTASVGGKEDDVLARVHAVAHKFRWRPESILHRWTADDAWKDSTSIQRAINGERVPAEWGGEAFTLAMLDAAHGTVTHPHYREHITYAIYGSLPPSPTSNRVWTIDTQADYDAACALVDQVAA
jgi:spore coat polysaccharide biosynthesis protein SpsF